MMHFFPSLLYSLVDSKLPYDVTPEQAMSHEEVRTRLETSIKTMKTITDKFLSAIVSSVETIPYVPHFYYPDEELFTLFFKHSQCFPFHIIFI